jgi:hypothetical protein
MDMTRRLATLALPLAALAGCAQFKPPPPGVEHAGPGGGCGKKTAIEDSEDGDDQILVVGGRNGYIYTFADDKGTKVAPTGDFKPASGGADGSNRSMRFSGTTAAGEAYAGLGFSFKDPEATYDASRYTGVAFWAKRSAASATGVRFMVGDVNTDPLGKVCTECDNDFGVSFEVTEQWTRYVVSFADLKQEGGWGAPRPEAIDKSKIYGLKWQVSTPGTEFDVSIDQVSFVCGE